MNLYNSSTQNDFSSYVNSTASPLNPLANSILSQSISKSSSIDTSFLVKQSSKQPSNNPNPSQQQQHNDLIPNHPLYPFFDSSSVPPSSQSPILFNTTPHDNAMANFEKLKQEYIKEKQNSLKIENTFNNYKLLVDKCQKDNIDWKNKYLILEHEKTQVS